MPSSNSRRAPGTTKSMLSGFEPIVGNNARVLILGSMPGAASLQAHRYYAHPQNRFWPMLGELVGAEPTLPYQTRCKRLIESGIALWDVFAQCERAGSLDSAIRDATAQANDFVEFFGAHTDIRGVLFNGAKAEQGFRRFVTPWLATTQLHYRRLPSTSPANASQRAADKLEAWRNGLEWAGINTREAQAGPPRR